MSTRPISKGDRCRVINGVLRDKSPNVGKTVVVASLQGNHSKLGVIWRCTGPDLVSFNDMAPPDGAIDFPAIWLERIEPDAPPAKAIETKVADPVY